MRFWFFTQLGEYRTTDLRARGFECDGLMREMNKPPPSMCSALNLAAMAPRVSLTCNQRDATVMQLQQ